MSKGNYKKKTRSFIKHEKLTIIPAPNRVLIKVTAKQMQDLISKEIVLEDGTKKRLFFEPILFDQGYERRFQQSVSVGEAVGVGVNVQNVEVGDTLILDYLTSNLTDHLIGFFNKDQLISVLAETTYHNTSSVLINGRRAWAKGDFDNISMILGVVREDKLIPFDPYIFLEYQSDYLKILSMHGDSIRSKEPVVERVVLGSPDGCIYKCGERIKIKKDDWFDREINGYKIAICFRQDVICKSSIFAL
jgi:hypothetical protein